ncbi:MAG: (d)CMP kinase, partial [Planctomycetota bacterium]|nr:(d)CMP kinase [Planctomycetota bacterium]
DAMAEAARGLVFVDGQLVIHDVNVTDEIRTPAVTADVSRVSAVPQVRRVIQQKQREMSGRLVAEGRDIGTVVFPEADVKVFLDASLSERARRRHRQAPALDFEEYRQRIAKRDHLDSTREDSPLVRAGDAVGIDTSTLTIEEVVEQITALVRQRMKAKNEGVDAASAG